MLIKTAQHLGDFDRDARRLDASHFRDQHGDAFLVHYGSLSGFASSSGTTMVTSVLALRGEAPWHYDYFVFPLRKPTFVGGAADDVSRVGRGVDNDVTIPDPSLSKIHAYLTRRPSGLWTIEDAGSTNGTSVDGKLVGRRGASAPTQLHPGVRITFGLVELTFLLAEEFRSLVKRLGPVIP